MPSKVRRVKIAILTLVIVVLSANLASAGDLKLLSAKTDKEEYTYGDTIELTLKIKAEEHYYNPWPYDVILVKGCGERNFGSKVNYYDDCEDVYLSNVCDWISLPWLAKSYLDFEAGEIKTVRIKIPATELCKADYTHRIKLYITHSVSDELGGDLIGCAPLGSVTIYLKDDAPTIEIPKKTYTVKLGEPFYLDARDFVKDDCKVETVRVCKCYDGYCTRTSCTYSHEIEFDPTDKYSYPSEPTKKVFLIRAWDNQYQESKEKIVIYFVEGEKTYGQPEQRLEMPGLPAIFTLVLFTPFLVIPLLINLAILWWVYKDAKKRYPLGDNTPILWVIVCFFGGIIGLILYLLLRPKPESE